MGEKLLSWCWATITHSLKEVCIVLLSELGVLWKESLISDSQQFYQYQQKLQLPLTSKYWTQKYQHIWHWNSWFWLRTGTKMWQGIMGPNSIEQSSSYESLWEMRSFSNHFIETCSSSLLIRRGRRGRDRIVAGFKVVSSNPAHHEVYYILLFPPPIKLTATI
jgi:hypothetical protein